MQLRKFQPVDEPAVLALAIAAWRPIYQGYRETLGDELFAHRHDNWEERKKREVLEACNGNDLFTAFVAEIDSRLVGFITFRIDVKTREGIVGNNAVAPEYQGRGIAQEMYGLALEQMRVAGVRYVSVLTGGDAAHAAARRAYEKVGFALAIPAVTYHLLLEPLNTPS